MINAPKNLAPVMSLTIGGKLRQHDDLTRESKLRQQFIKLEKDPKFLEVIEKEFKELVDFVIEIDQKTDEVFDGMSTISFEELAKKLIILVDVTKTTLPMPLIKIGLRLFRKIIEMENEQTTLPAAEWENDDYVEAKNNIVKRQNQLVNIGLVNLLINAIASSKSSKDVKEEAVLVGISLLLGGNTNSQNAFYYELSQGSFLKWLNII
jgi:hypothetical protein